MGRRGENSGRSHVPTCGLGNPGRGRRSSGRLGIAAHPDRPVHRSGQVGDRAATPAADFVTDQPRPSQEPGADWSLGYDSSLTVLRPDRRHLDRRGHAIQVCTSSAEWYRSQRGRRASAAARAS
jgi:hypothetical protein